MINTSTKLSGLIGNPIQHSISPGMHNAHFRALGLNWNYFPMECELEDLKYILDGVRGMNFSGVNVTKPFKIEIMKYLNEIDALAKDIGSVNTIVKKGRSLIGYNTDGIGFYRDLVHNCDFTKDKNVLLMGAGGAGRACAVTLAKKERVKLFIVDQINQRAQKLAEICAQYIDAEYISYDGFQKMDMSSIHIFVNATGAGMNGRLKETPIKQEKLSGGKIAYDLSYYPNETQFLKEAKKSGLKTINGLNMVVYQGIEAFRLWSNLCGDEKVMMDYVRSCING